MSRVVLFLEPITALAGNCSRLALACAVVALLLLGGCSSLGMTVIDSPTPLSDDYGWAVFSAGFDTSQTTEFTGITSSILTLQFQDSRGGCGSKIQMHVEPNLVEANDFVDTGAANLFIIKLPRGRYSICSWQMHKGNSVAGTRLNIPFTLDSRQVVYLGFLNFVRINGIIKFQWSDSYDRDMPVFERRVPPLKRENVTKMIPSSVPKFVASAPRAAVPQSGN